jgi:hypothetical protein
VRVFVGSIAIATLLAAAVPDVGLAQAEEPTVDWVTSWTAGTDAKAGARGTLELSGSVQDGWHVYALNQRPGGPTALRVTIEDNPVATLAGTPSGTQPERRQDPSFGLETQFYSHSFALHVPVALKPGVAAGGQGIPVNVRFQMCSARECRPPKTVHLSVPVGAPPGV